MSKQITAIIVGAGHRAILYSLYALEHPDELKIVGVADPDPIRRKKVAEMHGFGEEMCFKSAEELAERPKLADAVINGTMDRQHVPTAVPLLRAGYDMLLEKPFAISEEEVNYLYKVVKETGRKVMICHVLRYAPFYVAIKQRLLSGRSVTLSTFRPQNMSATIIWPSPLCAANGATRKNAGLRCCWQSAAMTWISLCG